MLSCVQLFVTSWTAAYQASPSFTISQNMLKLTSPGSSTGKESTCNAGDPIWIPGSRRSTGEGIGYPLQDSWASMMAQLVKNPPAMWETWVQSLGWEDPLEKGKATHFRFAKIWTQLSDFHSHVHWVDDAIQLYHPLSPSSPALDFSQIMRSFAEIRTIILMKICFSIRYNIFMYYLTNFNSLLQFAYM